MLIEPRQYAAPRGARGLSLRMSKTLIILNDSPYGNERCYNALRLAASLARAEDEELRLFLVGDAASCAKSGQKVPQGYYNIELMLDRVTRSEALVGVCGTCMDARGIEPGELIPGTHRSSMDELTTWTQWADKVIVF
jgi:uncharacterized protein involved in oxidation of intracellular sulfur